MPVAQYPTNLQEAFTGVSVPAFMAARQQLQDAQTNEQMNQQKALQDYNLQEQKTPYELAKLGLENENQGYLNRQNASKATLDEQTLNSNISAKNSANAVQLDVDKVKQMGAMAQHASQIADLVESGKVPLLAVADKLPPDLAQVLSQPGGTQRLRQWANQVASHSFEQLNKMQEVNANNASAERRNAASNATTLKSMQMQIDAGRFDKASKMSASIIDQFNKAKKPQERMTLAGTGLIAAQMRLEDAKSPQEYAQIEREIKEWAAQRDQAQRDYEVEMQNTFKRGVDIGQVGNVPMVPPPRFDKGGKTEPKKDAQGRILLD